jgi:hypothetical protein
MNIHQKSVSKAAKQIISSDREHGIEDTSFYKERKRQRVLFEYYNFNGRSLHDKTLKMPKHLSAKLSEYRKYFTK